MSVCVVWHLTTMRQLQFFVCDNRCLTKNSPKQAPFSPASVSVREVVVTVHVVWHFIKMQLQSIMRAVATAPHPKKKKI